MGQDSLNIDFLGTDRQFDWIELSIVEGDLNTQKRSKPANGSNRMNLGTNVPHTMQNSKIITRTSESAPNLPN